MELLADRFAHVDGGGCIDLATGERVTIVMAKAGEAIEQARWAVRCDALHKLRHSSIAALVDYGLVGHSQRFEAWRCAGAWSGSPGAAARVADRASAFVRACGLSCSVASVDRIRAHEGCSVWQPDAATGYAGEPPVDASGAREDDYGLVTIERRAVAVVAELLEQGSGCRPRVVAIWGPSGSGKRTVARELARVARLNGFVPMREAVFDAFSNAVARRSLFLIAAAHGERWSALLDSCLRTPRPHVLLLIGTEEVPTVHGLALDPLAPDALVSAVRPHPATSAAANRVRRFAEQSAGLPGVFLRLLCRCDPIAARHAYASSQIPSRVAEQAAVYGEADARRLPSAGEPASWPVPGELASLRHRVETGRRLAADGRHAPGERMLRQAIAALARRGDWAHAGEGGVTLARVLLQRGRARGAQEVLHQAHEWCSRAGDRARLLEIAALAGTAWTDLARLDEAESVLGGALAAARAEGETEWTTSVSAALARVAFWRGQYADVRRTTAEMGELKLRPAMAARVVALDCRAAVGLGDVGRAVSAASTMVRRAEATTDPRLIAEAMGISAFAHLAVGDVAALERDVAACLAAATKARDPLRALRARFLLIEGYRRTGRPRAAQPILDRIGKLATAGTPPIVRARWELLREAMKAAAPLEALVGRHVAATGLPALALYVAADGGRTADDADPTVTEIVDILHLCQTADEEGSVLRDVCARLRRHLHAAAVAVVALEGSACALVASDGARIDTGVAERAIAAGITIAPHQRDDRLEAASPVRYGGAIIGAVMVRWALGTPHGPSRAATLLPTAATAAGPAVSAAVGRRARPSSVVTTELVGVSAAIGETRRAVERAAPAPFAVLVEGESGSGKELVARALHRGSSRRERTFCTVNCAALPDDLLEAELFGHTRGAFTGALAERAGVFEEAHGGTLFLDEAGELSPRAQAKLLRVIQEGELRRIGENVSRRIDVRIVSATNRDLRAEAAAGRFRLDLLYRLDVIRIVVPPLRERGEDIPILVDQLWREAAARVGSRASLAAATIGALARYHWPGNVRELQNVLAALAVRAPKRGVVPPTALPAPFGEARAADTWRLDEARRTFEARVVRAALVRAGGHRARAAEELGVSRQGLTKLLTRLGIE